MIKIICGEKGTGKTKQLIETANNDVNEAKGVSVFITDTKRYMYDVSREVRFIDVKDYDVCGEAAFCGFVKGVAAANNDTENIYIDGMARMTGKELSELAATVYMLEKIANEYGIKIVISCSCAKENLPEFIAKYC